MKHYEIIEGKGKHRVFLYATVTDRGILASLVGGEEPHLGGVVLTVPRPSLANPDVVSCTSSVLPLVGHKDDEAARPLAEMLARNTGFPVSVAAGIHVKNAGAGDIEELKKNCLACGKKLLEYINKKTSG
ncbi:MAG: prenylated flavin chaperone LpdD [Desulfocucumaceae bacterium]